MKILLFIIFILFTSQNSYAQTFDIVRSIYINSLVFGHIDDTASNIGSYEHTGSMTIANGSITFNTLQCLTDVCIKDNKTRKIILVSENNKSVAIEHEDSLLGAKLYTIIALQPNIILLEPFSDGSAVITEWKLRNK